MKTISKRLGLFYTKKERSDRNVGIVIGNEGTLSVQTKIMKSEGKSPNKQTNQIRS